MRALLEHAESARLIEALASKARILFPAQKLDRGGEAQTSMHSCDSAQCLSHQQSGFLLAELLRRVVESRADVAATATVEGLGLVPEVAQAGSTAGRQRRLVSHLVLAKEIIGNQRILPKP